MKTNKLQSKKPTVKKISQSKLKPLLENGNKESVSSIVNSEIQKVLDGCDNLLFAAQKTKGNLERQLENNTEKEHAFSYMETFLYQHGDEWINLCDAFEGASEMGIEKETVQKLYYYHYRINNLLLECKLLAQGIENAKLKTELEKEKQEVEQAQERSEDIVKKLENIGSTVIGMILSLGIVTTLVSAVDKVDVKFLPMFVICTLWLGMTMLVFVSRWFQYSDEKVKESKTLYIIISIFTIFVIVYTIYFSLKESEVIPLEEQDYTAIVIKETLKSLAN